MNIPQQRKVKLRTLKEMQHAIVIGTTSRQDSRFTLDTSWSKSNANVHFEGEDASNYDQAKSIFRHVNRTDIHLVQKCQRCIRVRPTGVSTMRGVETLRLNYSQNADYCNEIHEE